MAQPSHPADLGELGGLELERQGGIASQQIVFGAHDFGQVGLGDHPVVVDGFEGETPGIAGGEAGEIAHEEIEGFVGGLDLGLTMLGAPVGRHFIDDSAQLNRRGQWQAKMSRERSQILRHGHGHAHQHHGGAMVVVREGDVLEKAHVDGVLQVWVKIKQHKKRVRGGCLDEGEDFLRFEHGVVRLIVRVVCLHAFGDGPAIGLKLKLLGDLPQHLDDLRFLVAFDRDQRCA